MLSKTVYGVAAVVCSDSDKGIAPIESQFKTLKEARRHLASCVSVFIGIDDHGNPAKWGDIRKELLDNGYSVPVFNPDHVICINDDFVMDWMVYQTKEPIFTLNGTPIDLMEPLYVMHYCIQDTPFVLTAEKSVRDSEEYPLYAKKCSICSVLFKNGTNAAAWNKQEYPSDEIQNIEISLRHAGQNHYNRLRNGEIAFWGTTPQEARKAYEEWKKNK